MMKMHKKSQSKSQNKAIKLPRNGFIREIVRDLAVGSIVLVVQSGKQSQNLIVDKKTIVLIGNEAGTDNDLEQGQTINYKQGAAAHIDTLSIAGGVVQGSVASVQHGTVNFTDNNKKKSHLR